MSEQQIVVVFDVTAETRELAAMAVAGVLSDDGIESWWFPEADLKHIDRNDNPEGVLVFGDDIPDCGYCGTRVTEWPSQDCEEPQRHVGATHDCACGDTVTIAEAIANPSKHRRCNLIGASS